jgi:hypothetical protein
VLARIALAAIALLAAGWLALGYPGAHDEARARSLLARPVPELTPAERADALAALRGARRFRPDGAVELREASLLTLTGHRPAAAALLRRLLAREPRNVTAWTLLAFADPHEGARARARARALSPPVR